MSGGDVTGVDFEFHCRATVNPTAEIDVPTQGPGDVAIPPSVDPTKPITIVDPPHHGTVVADPDRGVFVYTPNPGYQGRDQFTFTGTGRDGRPVTMTLRLRVIPMLPPTGAFGTTWLVGLGLGVAGLGALLRYAARNRRRTKNPLPGC